nr:MAG TPA: hypothetical protein [Caudoviricetes sp.]
MIIHTPGSNVRDVASSSSLVPLPIMAVPDTDLSVPISPFTL